MHVLAVVCADPAGLCKGRSEGLHAVYMCVQVCTLAFLKMYTPSSTSFSGFFRVFNIRCVHCVHGGRGVETQPRFRSIQEHTFCFVYENDFISTKQFYKNKY